MKKYEKIELNEKEYLMVTEESNVFEVVLTSIADCIESLINLIINSKKSNK